MIPQGRWIRSIPAWLGFALAFHCTAAGLDLSTLVPGDIGAPVISGNSSLSGAALTIEAGGTGIGLRSDQFHFAAAPLTNDFDLKFEVTGLSNIDALTKAGLMVRESLDPSAPFVAIFTSPTTAGIHFQSRASASLNANVAGNFPSNLPQSWLRLQRAGDLFTGFASYDGIHWVQIGTAAVTMGNPYVGFAVTSRSANVSTKALIQNIADAGPTDVVVPALPSELEPPGPTSRRTALVISEIMYHPAERADGRRTEFIEIYNSQPFMEDLSSWRIEGDYTFTLPANTVVPGGGFLLVAPAPQDIKEVYGIQNVVGGFTNALSHSDGRVKLVSDQGAIYQDVHYRDKAPWPLAADGTGHSLALARPSFGEQDPHAWAASTRPGGSPGEWEYIDLDPRRAVRLNELLARQVDGGPEAFIELYNHSNVAVDLEGCGLGYDALKPDFVFPKGAQIAPRAFLTLTPSQLGFTLRIDAETLYFRAPKQGVVLDAVRFDASMPGISRGRYTDGADEFDALEAPTPDLPNRPPALAPVVLNELMYAPLSGDKDLQYVELHNPGKTGVDLSGWKLDDGIEFTFPAGTSLSSGGYLVVARNASRLRQVYTNLTTASCLGNFKGSLSGRGEHIALTRPETSGPRLIDVLVDEVTYGTGGQWGHWSDGGGSSLELVDPRAKRRSVSSWADSDESTKGRWTLIESTGLPDLGGDSADSLHLGLLGEGECLVDNLEVIPNGTTNFITNPTFETPVTTGFGSLGNHVRSNIDSTEGQESTRSLHIRASGNMDTGANRIRFRFPRPVDTGAPVTLRARVRWLKGWPEFLMRLHGNWYEATGSLDVPLQLGTPGARNSRAADNIGPSLSDLSHFPVTPGSSQPVRFSVRVQDPDGVESLKLKYRFDPASEYQELAMVDDGTHGDEIAGDGVFSASLPDQASGTLVAYYVEATDRAANPMTTQIPRGAPVHEALVRFGEIPAGNPFGAYRIWLTQRALNNWKSRPNLSNEPVEGTLVYGSFRAIHGAGYRYSGSPYHQIFSTPAGDCHYVWKLPADDQLLGTDNFNKIHGPGNGPFDDDTIQREQTVYWMGRQIGLPWLYRRYVNVYVNGAKRRFLMEDTQVPGSDMMDSYFPDDANGNLFKLNPWFEFDAGTSQSINFNNLSWCDLNDYRSGNERRISRYRWNWQPRAVNGTVNDFSEVFKLVDAASAPNDTAFITGMESLVDMNQWIKTFALNHAVGNWDSFGNRNAQNMYAYKPERGPWRLFMWDANIVLGNAGFSDGPQGDDLFQYNFSDSAMGRIYNTPRFRRMYLQAFKEIANGPMQASKVGALIDSKASIFQNYGFSSTGASIKTYIRNRVSYLNEQLAPYNTSFSASIPGVNGGTTSQNSLFITGTAPLNIARLTLNGTDAPIQWDTETTWRIPVLLESVDNTFLVEAWDAKGQPIAGASKRLQVQYTGALEQPREKLVFTEIQYRPPVPGAEFVELMNASSSITFGIGGWRISGLDYTFPPGTSLQPGQRYVVTANINAFRSAYDLTRAQVQDVYTGKLNPNGEVLRLIKPGVPPKPDEIITSVAFSNHFPWPDIPTNTPSSLQLIDASRSEEEHVGNWGVVLPRNPNEIEWKQVSTTGKAGTNGTLELYLTSNPAVVDPLNVVGTFFGGISFNGVQSPAGVRFQTKNGMLSAGLLFDLNNLDQEAPLVGVSQSNLDVRFGFDPRNRFVGKLSEDGSLISGNYITEFGTFKFQFPRLNPGGNLLVDDLVLQESEAGVTGENLIVNGDFESGVLAPWQPVGTHAGSQITTGATHSGRNALRLQATGGGDGSGLHGVLQSLSGLVGGKTYTLSYWYQPTTNASGLMIRVRDGSLSLPIKLESPKDPHNESTPGYANANASELPAFPDVWLNEILPNSSSNTPYVELYNHGILPVDLGGLYLSEPNSTLLRDPLPTGAVLAAGEFLTIALDGKALLSDKANLHSSMQFAGHSGTITLSRVASSKTNLVDFLQWDSLAPDFSWGHFPDGWITDDRAFAVTTPGNTNTIATPSLPIRINEWLAGNTRFADPAGGPGSTEFDDWFELFNPNNVSVDLNGYFLSDSLDTPTQFKIPAGYVLPAQGFLMVWADGQPSQNQPTTPDLHANFKLALAGEAIVLSAPDGHRIDSVLFGAQVPDVSEGRPTDGSAGAPIRFQTPSPGHANGGLPPAPPTLDAPAINALGQVTLTWTTEPGRRYQLRTRTSLETPWATQAEILTATGPVLHWTDNRPVETGRFYQVLVVD